MSPPVQLSGSPGGNSGTMCRSAGRTWRTLRTPIIVHVMRGATFVGFIPAPDLATARVFYTEVLGLTLKAETPFALVVDGGGTTLRLIPVPDLQPQPFTIAGWAVDDIVAEVDALVSSGVTFKRYDGMEQDERAIWTTPGGDRVAWFSDPFNNTLSLTELADS